MPAKTRRKPKPAALRMDWRDVTFIDAHSDAETVTAEAPAPDLSYAEVEVFFGYQWWNLAREMKHDGTQSER